MKDQAVGRLMQMMCLIGFYEEVAVHECKAKEDWGYAQREDLNAESGRVVHLALKSEPQRPSIGLGLTLKAVSAASVKVEDGTSMSQPGTKLAERVAEESSAARVLVQRIDKGVDLVKREDRDFEVKDGRHCLVEKKYLKGFLRNPRTNFSSTYG